MSQSPPARRTALIHCAVALMALALLAGTSATSSSGAPKARSVAAARPGQ
jgi:hypothetical protein